MVQNSISIVNTGLSYDIVRGDGYKLCSFPTKRLAERRLAELSAEFDVPIVSSAKSASRGLRNNNPANIRRSKSKWKGLLSKDDVLFKSDMLCYDKEFCQFETISYGVRALIVLLRTYTRKYNYRTVYRIISHYAPSSDGNNVEKYCAFILENFRKEGFSISLHDSVLWSNMFTKPYSPSKDWVLYSICSSICKMESGFDLSEEQFKLSYFMM